MSYLPLLMLLVLAGIWRTSLAKSCFCLDFPSGSGRVASPHRFQFVSLLFLFRHTSISPEVAWRSLASR